MKKSIKKLLLPVLTTGSAIFGYQSRAYSACSVDQNNPGIVSCSGANTTPITITNPISVTTEDGFSAQLDNANPAIKITFDDNFQSFTDANNSVIRNNSGDGISIAINGVGNSEKTINLNSDIITKQGTSVNMLVSGFDINTTFSGTIGSENERSFKGISLNAAGDKIVNLTLTQDSSIKTSVNGLLFSGDNNATFNIKVSGDINSDDAAIKSIVTEYTNFYLTTYAESTIYSLNEQAIAAKSGVEGKLKVTINGSNIESKNDTALTLDSRNNPSVVEISNGATLKGINGIVANNRTNNNMDSSLDITINGSSEKPVSIIANGDAIIGADKDDTISIIGDVNITGNLDGGGHIIEDKITFTNSNLKFTNSTVSNFEGVAFSGDNTITGQLGFTNNQTDLGANGSITFIGDTTITNLNVVAVDDVNTREAININSANATFTNSSFSEIEDLNFLGTNEISGLNVTANIGRNDIINFNNSTTTFNGTNSLTQFETVNFNGNNILNGNMSFGNAIANINNNSSLAANGLVSASSFNVNSGGKIAGSGSLTGDVTVNNGGEISPGNANNSNIATLKINGDLNLNSGSKVNINLDGNNLDKIIASGDVTIEDGAILNLIPLSNSSGSGTIIESEFGQINGTFNNILNSGRVVQTIYPDGNNVVLNFSSFDGSILDRQIQSSVDNSILFSDVLTGHLSDEIFNRDKNFWGRALYRSRNLDKTSTQYGAIDEAYGGVVGLQFDVTDNFELGFSAAQIDDKLKLDYNLGSKRGNSSYLALHSSYVGNNFFIALSGTYGYHQIDTTRAVTNNGNQEYAYATSKGQDFGANAQLGYKFNINKWYFMPKLSASYIKSMFDGFTEREGGNSAVTVKDYTISMMKYRQGVRFGRNDYYSLFKRLFSPFIEAGAWQERTIGNRKIKGRFNSNNAEFTINLADQSRNFVYGSVGIDMKFTKNFSGFILYENAISKDETRHETKAGLSLAF